MGIYRISRPSPGVVPTAYNCGHNSLKATAGQLIFLSELVM